MFLVTLLLTHLVLPFLVFNVIMLVLNDTFFRFDVALLVPVKSPVLSLQHIVVPWHSCSEGDDFA